MRRLKSIYQLVTYGLFLLFTSGIMQAQTEDLRLIDWQPKSQMIVEETRILMPKFPVIDIHNHLRSLDDTKKYLEEMDKAGVIMCVSLDAGSQDDFYKKHFQVSQSIAKDRFILFFRPDFTKINEPDFGIKEAKKLEEAVR